MTGLALSKPEVDRLALCEDVIRRGLATFVEVGQALAEVRDSKLYRDSHGTFEAYCDARWSLSYKRAYDMIQAARVIDETSPIGDVSSPTNEAQARELAPLLDEPEDLREVWQETLDRTAGAPTAAAIRQVRKDRAAPPPPPARGSPPALPRRSAPPRPPPRSEADHADTWAVIAGRCAPGWAVEGPSGRPGWG